MGKVIIQKETTIDPISLIGREAGVCWEADINDTDKNYKRGIDCLISGHGRTWEYPQVFMILDGYSARVIREFYTHISGGPTRLQASTRYINYKDFDYVTPPSIKTNGEVYCTYKKTMADVVNAVEKLETLGVPREDIAMLLPLGMTTKVVVRTNLRNLIDMSHQRLCARAYWEYRQLMRDIMDELSKYSDEWKYLVHYYFVAKCDVAGYCTEKKSCGKQVFKEHYL